MKKKICLSVIAAMLLLQAVVSADVVRVSYLEDNADYIVISGDERVLADTKVTVSIFGKGKTYADLSGNFEDESDILAFAGVTYTDDNQIWKLEWKPESSGEYDFYVAADGTLLGSTSSTIVSGMSGIYSKIINGTESDIAESFAIPEVVKTFVPDESLRAQIGNSENIALSIYNIRENTENIDIISYIPLAARMAALDNTLSTAALDALVAEMGNFNITISNLQVYTNYATDAIKEKMAIMLDGTSELSIQEFNSKFTEAMILSGVWKCTNWTEAQTFLALMNNEYYQNNKDKVAQAVAGIEYTMTGLENAIIAAVNTNTNSPGTGGGGGGGGGSSNDYVPPITVKVTEPETEPEEEKTEPLHEVKETIFNDVNNGHWAYDYINLLRWKNIVNGDEHGYFYPDKNITRAETVKMLCEAFGIEPVSSGKAFEDVDGDKWYAGYVYAAYGKGLVSGTGKVEFNPTNNITRQDLAVMIYRFATANAVSFEKTSDISFTDRERISEYAAEAMETLAGAGVITGMDDGTVSPMKEATRAQAAVMLCKVLDAGKQVGE